MTKIIYSATLSSGEVVTRTVDTDRSEMSYTHVVEATKIGEPYPGYSRTHAAQWCMSETNAHKAARTLSAPRWADTLTDIRIVPVTAQVKPTAAELKAQRLNSLSSD